MGERLGKRPQGRPRTKRDPWDFKGPYSVEPIRAWWLKDKEAES